MERSPVVGSFAKPRFFGSDSLGEGIIKYVYLLSDLKGFAIRIVLGPKVFSGKHTNGDLEAKMATTCAGFLKGKWTHGPQEPSDNSMFCPLSASQTFPI
jgi:hypothetical protein